MQADKILIIDFGSQYTKLIARKIRELGVYSEIISCRENLSGAVSDPWLKGIVLSGGPGNVYNSESPAIEEQLHKSGKPILGICYGLQLISKQYKGKVAVQKVREYGRTEIHLRGSSDLFRNVKKNTTVWMSHGDSIAKMPEGFKVTSVSCNGLVSSFESRSRKIYAVQFHPEVAHTSEGKKIIHNFLFTICKVKNKWKPASFIEEKITEIRNIVRDEKAICALSGGVDSAVAAYLVNKAIGKNLICVHIDNGLMRKNESRDIVNYFSDKLNLKFIDGSALFLKRLRKVKDPEKKRKIIGKTFIDLFQDFAARQKGVKYLVQGTLYPDVIESSSFSGPSSVIKTHHNVGGLPEKLHLKLIEPLKELFKDEVRKIGEKLGVPQEILRRHPFPGPGLAVRIISDVTEEKLELLREADYIYINLLNKYDLYDKIWQAFCVLLPVSTVGVMGDSRTYEKVLALRAVESSDGMTANWFKIPSKVLEEISTEITNKVKGINRVVYDISNKPPSTIEWE
jgi:GMP synthase (glutamine-hydrolysing)